MTADSNDALIRPPIAEALALQQDVKDAPAENLKHHCPLCHRDFDFTPFVWHAAACIDAHPAASAGDTARP